MRRVFIAAALALTSGVVPAQGISRPSGSSRVAGAVLAERAGRVTATNITLDSPIGVVDGVGYRASAEAGPAGLSIVFPEKADGTYAVLRGDAGVAFSVRGAAPSTIEVSKGKVAYRELFPGVDAVHQLNGNRSEEFLVLKDERATTEFTYDLDVASGVEFSRLPTGGMRFSAEGDDGDTLSIEAPYVVDATGRTSYEAARYEIDREVAGQATVRLTVDTKGLAFPVAVDPTWAATTSMSTARTQHAAALLTNGRVMVVGGSSSTGLLTACEIYNPTSATWAATGSLNVGRTFHTATLLNGGNVLACGGYGGAQSVTSAEVWNVTTKTWSLTGQMSQGRERHTATLLPDGRVLVSGGFKGNQVPTATCEIFNPASGTWSNTGSFALARGNHSAVLLNDGRVMVSGGETTNAQGTYVTTETVEIYNPATGTWAAASPCASRSRHAAALLADGRVLIAGGLSGGSPNVAVAIATAQIYNPQTGAWSNAPSMAVAAASLTFTVLTNGRVLATGGYAASTTSDNSQVYNPATNTWSAPDAGGLVWARTTHTATRLPSGTVLVCGGAALGGPFAMATAELR